MASTAFLPPVRQTKMIGSLHNDSLLSNPYIVDALLNMYYVPYDQTNEGTFKSLGVAIDAMNCFTDPGNKAKGRDVLLKLLKLLLMKERLYFTWAEGGLGQIT